MSSDTNNPNVTSHTALEDIRNQVRHALNSGTPENHERFFSRFSISNEQRRKFMENAQSDSSLGSACPTLPIPKLIHRIWLTDPLNPAVPPEGYLKRIASQCRRLGTAYSYVFWHNSEQTASLLGEYFRGTEMVFRNIVALGSEPQLLQRIDLAISHKKYVLAGDISKYLVLREIGGVYADLGVDFGNPLLDLLKITDAALFLDSGLFFQPAFMAAPPNLKPFRIWCSLLSRPEVVSAIGLSDSAGFTPGNEIWVHGGIGFTAALILFFDHQYRLLPVPPNRGLLHSESQGSWYRPGNKYGNASIASAPVTHLNWNQHLELVQLNRQRDDKSPHLSSSTLVRLNVAQHLSRLYWLEAN